MQIVDRNFVILMLYLHLHYISNTTHTYIYILHYILHTYILLPLLQKYYITPASSRGSFTFTFNYERAILQQTILNFPESFKKRFSAARTLVLVRMISRSSTSTRSYCIIFVQMSRSTDTLTLCSIINRSIVTIIHYYLLPHYHPIPHILHQMYAYLCYMYTYIYIYINTY